MPKSSSVGSHCRAKRGRAAADSLVSLFYPIQPPYLSSSLCELRGNQPLLSWILMSTEANITLTLTKPCLPEVHVSVCCSLRALIILWNTAHGGTSGVLESSLKAVKWQLGNWDVGSPWLLSLKKTHTYHCPPAATAPPLSSSSVQCGRTYVVTDHNDGEWNPPKIMRSLFVSCA